MKMKVTKTKVTDHFAWLPKVGKARLDAMYAAHQTRMRSDIYNTATNPDGNKEIEMKMKKYTVRNTYGIAGESNHRSYAAARKAAYAHEGEGWIVVDAEGHRVEPYYRAVSGGGWEAVPERV